MLLKFENRHVGSILRHQILKNVLKYAFVESL